MDRELAAAVARAPRVTVDGLFCKHVSPRWADHALIQGSRAGGRWAATGSFPVIYLGRPVDSVVVEAYRHLVDDIEGMSPERVRGRVLLTAQIHANEVIDLTTAASRLSVGLSEEDLVTDVGDYEKCNRIGHVAHQLACHGILVPAATGLGETLALFVDFLTVAELPTRVGEPVKWMTLPRDPRRLRVVREDQAHPPA